MLSERPGPAQARSDARTCPPTAPCWAEASFRGGGGGPAGRGSRPHTPLQPQAGRSGRQHRGTFHRFSESRAALFRSGEARVTAGTSPRCGKRSWEETGLLTRAWEPSDRSPRPGRDGRWVVWDPRACAFRGTDRHRHRTCDTGRGAWELEPSRQAGAKPPPPCARAHTCAHQNPPGGPEEPRSYGRDLSATPHPRPACLGPGPVGPPPRPLSGTWDEVWRAAGAPCSSA